MKTFVLSFGLLIVVLLPWRNEGEWRNTRTNLMAHGSARASLNRWYFGYLPEYHWVGYRPTKHIVRDGFENVLPNDRDVYQIMSRTLVIDWAFLLTEIILAAFAISFIYRTRQR